MFDITSYAGYFSFVTPNNCQISIEDQPGLDHKWGSVAYDFKGNVNIKNFYL